jgi:hypothetical protein
MTDFGTTPRCGNVRLAWLQFGADRHGALRSVAAKRSFSGKIKKSGQGAIRSG